jgi:hypothetical protein
MKSQPNATGGAYIYAADRGKMVQALPGRKRSRQHRYFLDA